MKKDSGFKARGYTIGPGDLIIDNIVSFNPDMLADKKAKGEALHRQRFIIKLGLFFNDLKGLVFLQSIASQISEGSSIDPTRANITGMKLQMLRYMCGSVHEVLEFLNEPNSKIVLSSSFIKEIEKSLPEIQKDIWLSLIAVSHNIKLPKSSRG